MYHLHELEILLGNIAMDNRVTLVHFRLYVTLFQYSNLFAFRHPLTIPNELVMKIAGIADTDQFLQCIRDLDQYGYIHYVPSSNLYALVYLNYNPSGSS